MLPKVVWHNSWSLTSWRDGIGSWFGTSRYQQNNTFLGSCRREHKTWRSNAEYIVTGLEYSYAKIMFLRIGHKVNKQEEDFTFGLGIIVPVGPLDLSVDYGYANFDHLSDPKRFSIGLTL